MKREATKSWRLRILHPQEPPHPPPPPPGVFWRTPTLVCCQRDQNKHQVSWGICRNRDLRVRMSQGMWDTKCSPSLIKHGSLTDELCFVKGQTGKFLGTVLYIWSLLQIVLPSPGGCLNPWKTIISSKDVQKQATFGPQAIVCWPVSEHWDKSWLCY